MLLNQPGPPRPAASGISNLSGAECQALRALRKDDSVVIKKADNRAVVIIDTDDHVLEVCLQLQV